MASIRALYISARASVFMSGTGTGPVVVVVIVLIRVLGALQVGFYIEKLAGIFPFFSFRFIFSFYFFVSFSFSFLFVFLNKKNCFFKWGSGQSGKKQKRRKIYSARSARTLVVECGIRTVARDQH